MENPWDVLDEAAGTVIREVLHTAFAACLQEWNGATDIGCRIVRKQLTPAEDVWSVDLAPEPRTPVRSGSAGAHTIAPLDINLLRLLNAVDSVELLSYDPGKTEAEQCIVLLGKKHSQEVMLQIYLRGFPTDDEPTFVFDPVGCTWRAK